MQDYGGTLVWEPYCVGIHNFGQWITDGIAAKNLDKTYYVAGVYTDVNGNTHCTGVIAYPLSRYCLNNAKPGKDMQALAAATAMYGYYAAQFFDN